MNDENCNQPHGGSLVNLLVEDQRAAKLKEIVLNLPDITLNDRQLCDSGVAFDRCVLTTERIYDPL